MNTGVRSIIKELENIHEVEPWYGKPVIHLQKEVDEIKASLKPSQTVHSATELLYHIVTWSEFTLNRIEGKREQDPAIFEKQDCAKWILSSIPGKECFPILKLFIIK